MRTLQETIAILTESYIDSKEMNDGGMVSEWFIHNDLMNFGKMSEEEAWKEAEKIMKIVEEA